MVVKKHVDCTVDGKGKAASGTITDWIDVTLCESQNDASGALETGLCSAIPKTPECLREFYKFGLLNKNH